ncbi:GntR family transcriptional regulator [Aldersonia sp. NBC_00410]|uniref:FadR/GntR family transcriptional regulator n=1 Tax=Aldersonia sp. NBC_00410 TaxID=2975954 RepID=UPI0022573B4B|nr:GntR family transcriptional regulator [Aldersonia sp. NBC_00410]MCX5042264.1 GntR family transcriptional regulator [Aldersonia sp. NBC_00410]
MTLEPVNRRSVPEEVFEQIAAKVLDGDFRPGEALPSERRLAEVLGVSRPTVREAIKRLSAAGLVEVRQGDATTVRDYRRHAGMELLPQLLIRSGGLDVSVARSMLEARMHNGPKVAELAALRADENAATALRRLVDELESATDPVQRQLIAMSYWDRVVDAADSIAFRLMFNTLRAAYEPVLPAMAFVMDAEVGRPEAYHALANAIGAGEPAAAAAAARDLLEPATFTMLTALDALEKMP